MRIRYSVLLVVLTCITGLSIPNIGRASDTAYIRISTSTNNDTLVSGLTSSVIIDLDIGSDSLGSASIYLLWLFTSGNVVGVLLDTGSTKNVFYSSRSLATFELFSWDRIWGEDAADPDTTWIAVEDVGGPTQRWTDRAELFRCQFAPSDTGFITIFNKPDEGPPVTTMVVDWQGLLLPVTVDSTKIRVAKCEDVNLVAGDIDLDGVASSADIVKLVNFIFKSGEDPPILETADGNCDSTTNTSDIIKSVNYIFKSGDPPCDVCQLINQEL